LSTYYAPLQLESLLHISGPDTLTFLQGQLTCDTRGLDESGARTGAYCTPQGRVVCDFLLGRLGEEHYALRLRRDIRATAAATLGKYIVFSKAELDAERDDWQVLGIWGEDSAATLAELFGAAPEAQLGDVRGDGFVLVQTDAEGTGFECYLDASARPDLLEVLDSRLQLSGEEDWRCRQIRSGIGRIEAATTGEFIPQMLNYDLTGHISFNKGCYTGQEVVARLHYRGKPKRRMYLATLASAGEATAGAPLYSQSGAQGVGNVVNSAPDPEGNTLLLAVATADGAAAGLHLGASDGPLLDLLELPYSLGED
jgi:folate-binding protein YgfZ